MAPVRVGISSCLLGERVRYDGGHKRDRFLTEELGRQLILRRRRADHPEQLLDHAVDVDGERDAAVHDDGQPHLLCRRVPRHALSVGPG